MSLELNPIQRSLRSVIHRIYNQLDRALIVDPNGTLQTAGEAALNSEGNLFVITHFGTGDLFPMLFELIFGTDGLEEKYALSPQSFHQEKWIISQLVRTLGSQFLPVINPSAKSHPRLERLSEDELSTLRATLMSAFLSTSAEVLTRGGTVVIAEGATRAEYLNMEGPNTIGLFLQAMRRLKTPAFGITPIGLSLKDQVDYSKARGLNLNKTYVMHVGSRTLSSEHTPRAVDTYLRRKLSELVPDVYRQPSRV